MRKQCLGWYRGVQAKEVKVEDHLGDLIVNGRIVLKLLLQKLNLNVWRGFSGLEIGTSGGLL
jgi:hypothetical protein